MKMDFKKLFLFLVILVLFIVAGLNIVNVSSIRKLPRFINKRKLLSNKFLKRDDISLKSLDTPLKRDDSAVTSITLDTNLKASKLRDKQEEIENIGCRKSFRNLHFSELKEHWQPVEENSSKSHHVYSAYHQEDHIPPCIRMVGIINKSLRSGSLICQLWYRSSSGNISMTLSKAVVEPLHDGQDSRHTVSFFRCSLPNNEFPFAVSLTSQKCMTPHNLLPVRSHMVNDKDKKRFTVCVAPLYDRYNKIRELIEWIELNRILGADYFVFYNFSASVYVDRILNFYVRKNLVEVVPWNVSQFSTENEMHYYGQHATMNDCLMRMKNISEFVVNVDLDEVLIPHSKFSTWNDIVVHKPKYGGYLFKNSFFRLNWNNTEKEFPKKDIAIKYNLVTILKLRRETIIYRPKDRSKYFCRTKFTESMGTHEIFELKPGWQTYNLPPEVGLLHHYRTIYIIQNGSRIPDPYNDVSSLLDDTVYSKYKDTLIKNVIKIYTEIEEEGIQIL